MRIEIQNREQRQTKGEKNFEQHALPLVQSLFPGIWCSTNEHSLDYTHGIDYIILNGCQITTIAARIWFSYPQQHFALRWKRTLDIDRKLELDSKLDAYRANEMLPDWTVEAFHWKNSTYIACVETHRLMDVIARHYEDLPRFIISNPEDMVYFKRVPFFGYGLEPYIKKITKIASI